MKSASRVHKEQWTSEGVPFYRSSDVMAAINGTQNEKAFISEELYEKLSSVSGKLEEGDVLVTGGGSVGKPYIVPNNNPLYTKDADLLWIKNQGRFAAYFVYEFFLSPTFRSYIGSISHVGTIAHYTITQLSETPIYLPKIEEQRRIGDYFRNLDNLITLHQCLFFYSRLLKLIKCTISWEQRKFEELYKKSSEKNDGSIGMDKNITVATMQFKEDVKVSTEDYLRTYYTFNVGDIAFEGHQSKDFRFGRFVENDIGNGIVSHIFAVFRPIVDYDLKFWKYAINNESLMQRVLSRSTKASTMMHDLVTDDFLEQSFLVPSIEEQKQIGEFLAGIDNLITLHQCLDILGILKARPYTIISWEQRKLDDLCSLVTKQTGFDYSSTIKPALVNEHLEGTLPFIQNKDFSGNEINMDTDFYIPEEIVKKYPKITLDQPCLLISISGKIGNVGLYKRSERAFIGGAVGICRLLDNTNGEFIMQELLSDKGQHYFQSLIKASSHQNITVEDIRKIEIPMPSASEQEKISNFFENLDNLITLHQR